MATTCRGARESRIVYVHGRPGPHPNRACLLETIGATLVPVDARLPWADRPAPPRWRKYLSLLLCALTFPRRRQWDLVLGDGPQHLPVLLKALAGPRRRPPIVPYLAGEFPYFLATGYYGRRKGAVLRWWFERWDAYLCVGGMTAELVRGVLPAGRHRDVFTIQNFVRAARHRELARVAPDLGASRVLFIANGPSGFRAHYKGLDLMLRAFARAQRERPELRWSIVGDWDPGFAAAAERAAGVAPGTVLWLGPIAALAEVVAGHALYLHCARGDAWPNTVMEAMLGGVPALVSEWTGTRELVAEVDARLVAPLDAAEIAERIGWYFSLRETDRRELGQRGRQLIQTRCTEARAIERFRDTVRRMLDHLGLGHLRLPDGPGVPARGPA